MKVVDSVENMLEIDNGYLHVVSGTVWYALPAGCKCEAILSWHIPSIRSLQIQTLCSFFLKWQRIPKGLKFPGFSAVYYLDKGCFEKFELEARRSSRRRGRVSTHTQSVLSKIVPPALARDKADADAGCVQCWVLCVDFLPYAVFAELAQEVRFSPNAGKPRSSLSASGRRTVSAPPPPRSTLAAFPLPPSTRVGTHHWSRTLFWTQGASRTTCSHHTTTPCPTAVSLVHFILHVYLKLSQNYRKMPFSISNYLVIGD